MAHSEVIDTKLVLVSARKSRGADHWDKDDYDVRLGDASGAVIGRIMRHPQAPEAEPWLLTITAREQPPSVYNRGYAASREQAMRYFMRRAGEPLGSPSHRRQSDDHDKYCNEHNFHRTVAIVGRKTQMSLILHRLNEGDLYLSAVSPP
jgi:hypothetical protein